jgi:hypothetical protein
MKEVGVQSFQSRVKKRTTGSPVKTQSFKKRGIEVDRSHKLTIPQTRIEFESQKDKERGKGKLHWSTTT